MSTMAEPGGIPDLSYCHLDGTPRTRLEMEQWLRSEVPKVHWLRIIANRIFHLPKQISWDMREIVLKHWLLDEMVRQRFITGDVLGINSNASNDESELRQFTQKLVALIQSGQAVQPQHSEGIDMTSYTPPPPSLGITTPNGQPNTPPSFSSPPGPPMAPSMPQYQQAPTPPTLPSYSPSSPPISAPPMNGPPMGPPTSPPNVPAPIAPPRRGRPPKDPSAVQQQVAPSSTPAQALTAPPGFSPTVMPAPQSQQESPRYAVPMPNIPGINTGGFAPLPVPTTSAQVLPTTAPASELFKFEQKLDQLLNINKQQAEDIISLKRKVEIASMVTTILVRSIYHKEGSSDAAGLLAELGSPVPQ